MNRKFVRILGAATLAVAVAAGGAACAQKQTPSGSGDGKAACGYKIGFFGALTGGDASVVIPSRDGAEMAFEQYNAANPNCKIEFQAFDSEGDGTKAKPFAQKMVDDAKYLGVIGGAFSGETKQTMADFEGAGLAMVSQSATNPDLTEKENKGKKVFHRVVGRDDMQGPAAARYIKNVLKSKKVFIVNDGTEYGAEISKQVKQTLGNDLFGGEDTVQKKQTDFAPTGSKIKSSGSDAVIYLGYAEEAGPFVKQVKGGGFTGKIVGTDGIYGDAFPKAAGDAGEGVVITCPCLPAEKVTGSNFVADFKKKTGKDPGAYAAEGWDAATVFIEALKAGKSSRADVLAFVKAYDKKGLTKQIKFNDKGDVDPANVVIWAYTVKAGKIVAEAEIPKS